MDGPRKDKRIVSVTKTFAENYRPVTVEFCYEADPNKILASLTEFLYKQAKLIDYRDEKPEHWLSIYKAVLARES